MLTDCGGKAIPVPDDHTTFDYQTDTKPINPARTVREAILAQGRDNVEESFVRLIRDAVDGTNLLSKEGLRDHINDMVRRISEGFDEMFPDEFKHDTSN